jgi:type VI secretion system secreted protein VgrG
VRDVLERAGVAARMALGSSYPTREYTAQYRESDWRFVERLLEEEGIYYWFDHEEGASQLVLGDDSRAAPDLYAGAAIDVVDETGLDAAREVVFDLGDDGRVLADRFLVRSFDPDRPALQVEGSAGDGRHESYVARGAGPVSPEVAAARARVMFEHAASHRKQTRGTSTSVRLTPGRVVMLDGAPLFITHALTTLAQRQRGDGKTSRPPETRFVAIERAVVFRAPQDTPLPQQPGLGVGVVVGPAGEEVYPDDKGRVRVQFHWDRHGDGGASAGRFMRVNQRGTAGSMLLPRMGWNVFTMNEEGAADVPIALHRFFDVEHPPPYELPGNKTRTVFRTATTPSKALLDSLTGVGLGLNFADPDPSGGFGFNEIRYEDRQGAEEMFWNSSRDLSVLVQNDKIEQIKADNTRQVVVDHALDVGHDYAETIVGDQTIHIMGNLDEAVTEGRQKHVNGDESVAIGVNRAVTTGKGHSTNVTAQRTLRVGTAQIDISLGNITATAPSVHTLVGGAAIKLTVGGITETVGKGFSFGPISGPAVGGVLQTIGGAKLELSRGKRAIKAAKSYVENVGGMLSHLATAGLDDYGSGVQSIQVGGLLNAFSPTEIAVEGTAEVMLSCGASSIVINAAGIVISSPRVSISGGALQVLSAAKVEHNC